MIGNVKVNINKETLVEALQDYFDRQLRDGKQMIVADVSANTAAYGPLALDITLSEKTEQP